MFGVPAARSSAINERFRKEAAAIKGAFAARLGVEPMFKLRVHDFDRADALGPSSRRGRSRADEPRASTTRSTSTDLTDAPDAPPSDSVSRLVADVLGAEIVDERTRN